MPDPDEPLILSRRDACLRWNNYLKRTFRPAVESTAVRWAAVERKRLVAEEGMTRAEARMRAVKEAERLKKLTPHHLRHTAAALLWAAGASDIEVQLTLGHRDVETSKQLYAHLLSGCPRILGGPSRATTARSTIELNLSGSPGPRIAGFPVGRLESDTLG